MLDNFCKITITIFKTSVHYFSLFLRAFGTLYTLHSIRKIIEDWGSYIALSNLLSLKCVEQWLTKVNAVLGQHCNSGPTFQLWMTPTLGTFSANSRTPKITGPRHVRRLPSPPLFLSFLMIVLPGKIEGRRGPGTRRISCLANLRKFFGLNSIELFRAAFYKIRIVMMINIQNR